MATQTIPRSERPKPFLLPEYCKGCGRCIPACPKQAFPQIGGGVLLGLAGSFALSRLLRAWLFGVAPTDPGTFVAVTALLVAVALAAVYLPRAGRRGSIRWWRCGRSEGPGGARSRGLGGEIAMVALACCR